MDPIAGSKSGCTDNLPTMKKSDDFAPSTKSAGPREAEPSETITLKRIQVDEEPAQPKKADSGHSQEVDRHTQNTDGQFQQDSST